MGWALPGSFCGQAQAWLLLAALTHMFGASAGGAYTSGASVPRVREGEREREGGRDALSSSSRLAQICSHAGRRFPMRKWKLLQGLLKPRFGTCTSLCPIVLVQESQNVSPNSGERSKLHLLKGSAVKNLWPFLQSTPVCGLHFFNC